MARPGGKKGRKTQKMPLPEDKIAKIQNKASGMDDKNAVKIIKLLRYTGMHPVVIEKAKHKLREEKVEGKNKLIWDRPKKVGRDARTSIVKHPDIDFNVDIWLEAFRSKKRKKSRHYIWSMCQKAGELAGIPDVAPLTFRHSLAVNLLKKGVGRDYVQQILNCSDKTMQTYLKFVDTDKDAILQQHGY